MKDKHYEKHWNAICNSEVISGAYVNLKWKDLPEPMALSVSNLLDLLVPYQGPIETVKIKWKYVYYPFGGWFFEDGKTQPKVKGNFRAFYEGREILVIISEIKSYEGDIGSVPNLVDAQTFEKFDVDVEKVFIEISTNV
jgi:hypothetical protein